jgi:hypothetical protein
VILQNLSPLSPFDAEKSGSGMTDGWTEDTVTVQGKAGWRLKQSR